MASSFTQLTNIIRASEVTAKWGISAAELNERVNRGKLRIYWHRDTRKHPNGTIIYLCDGPYMRIPDDNGEYDLTPYVFEAESIAEYEAANPEVLWSVVSGHKGEDSDDIPAEQIQHELGMDRATFADMLNNYFGDRMPTSLEDEFRSFANTQGYDLSGHVPFFTIGMLKGLYIERLTWERWKREQKQKSLPDAVPLPTDAAIPMQEPALQKEVDALKVQLIEKDTRIGQLEKELTAAKGGVAETGNVDSGRWAASTAAVCRATIEVCRSGRTDWVSGQNSAGSTDSAGDETFNALLTRMYEGKLSVMTQAEREAWKVLAKAGLTWSGGYKPSKQNQKNPAIVEGE